MATAAPVTQPVAAPIQVQQGEAKAFAPTTPVVVIQPGNFVALPQNQMPAKEMLTQIALTGITLSSDPKVTTLAELQAALLKGDAPEIAFTMKSATEIEVWHKLNGKYVLEGTISKDEYERMATKASKAKKPSATQTATPTKTGHGVEATKSATGTDYSYKGLLKLINPLKR